MSPLLSDVWIDFVAGWCSGAVSTMACQPVDTILTRWQASNNSMAVWSSARALTSSAGVPALWRGASPMITAVPLQNSLLMGGYGFGTRYSELYYPSHKYYSIFVGGCTGGILQSFVMSPIELIKVTQQCAAGPASSSASALVATKQLVHGVLPLWRGLGATLLRDGIPHGVWFVAYEACKNCISIKVLPNDDKTESSSSSNKSSSYNDVAVPLVSGAVAATVAWGVGYPADLIKTRIQANTAPGSNNLGILETVHDITKDTRGLRGAVAALYRGFGLKLVRAVPASMIGFSVYEFVKRRLERL